MTRHTIDSGTTPQEETVFKTAALNHSATCPTPDGPPLSPPSAGKVTTSERAVQSHAVARSRGRSRSATTDPTTTAARRIPEGYRALDDVDARNLTPGTELFTPHPSAGQTPFGWGLAAVLVERVRESGAGEHGQLEVSVVDVSIPRGEGRITLAFAPGDLLVRKTRRGTVGS